MAENEFAIFLQNDGLYDKAEITKDNISDLMDLIAGKVRISLFCPECRELRVFSMEPITIQATDILQMKNADDKSIEIKSLASYLDELQEYQRLFNTPIPKISDISEKSSDWFWIGKGLSQTRVMTFHYSCTMNEAHKLDYIVRTEGNIIQKIGQFPSVADLAFPELDEYHSVINKADRGELRRAIGLYAQGIGVGAYVYLRRIFERIIDTAKVSALDDGKLDEEKYKQSRIADRIKMLKDYLPTILNSNPIFYSIVSKGIHELSEEQCIEYFPVMKQCILMILKQWEEKRKQLEIEAKISKSLSKIASDLK